MQPREVGVCIAVIERVVFVGSRTGFCLCIVVDATSTPQVPESVIE